MSGGRRVLRNQTTRKDAVYMVVCTLNYGVYAVYGRWGRWETFRDDGNMQAKRYYHGQSEGDARQIVTNLLNDKRGGGYRLMKEFNQPFPWELPGTTYPAQTPAAQAQPADPRNPTSAGVLDLD